MNGMRRNLPVILIAAGVLVIGVTLFLALFHMAIAFQIADQIIAKTSTAKKTVEIIITCSSTIGHHLFC